MTKETNKSWVDRHLIVYPDRTFYKFWHIIVVLVCTSTAVLWPFIIAMLRDQKDHLII